MKRATWGLVLVVGVSLPAAAAHAVSNTYNGVECRGITSADQARLTPSDDISIIASDDAEVVCPVYKTTSGPGITSNDDITSVVVTAFFGQVDCDLEDYQTQDAGSSSNVIAQDTDTNNGYYYTLTMSTGTQGYWGNSSAWKYAELHCKIYAGAGLYSYDVNENGSAQTSRRIVSSAACTPAAVSGSYHHTVAGGPAPGVWGGYLEHDNTGFTASCRQSPGAGAYTQIALGPSVTSDRIGCKRASSGGFSFVSGSTPQYLSFASDTLICQHENNPSGGDGRIFSYRTAPTNSF
jgi:hypothetical protein